MRSLIAKLPAAFLVLGLGVAPLALIGGGQPAHAQSQQFSDEQLEAFAVAESEVRQISGQLQQQLSNAGTQEEARALREEANQQMVHAVRRTGLDVETYNDISQTARSNPEIAEQIEEIQQNMSADQ